MQRLVVLLILIASVAAGMAISRWLLPAGEPTSSSALAQQMRDSVAPASGGGFRLPNLDGETRGLDDWAGRMRLVNFWATWCAPCRREIPLLKSIQTEHGEAGIQVIGIAVDEVEPVIEYAAEMDFNYPVLIGEEEAIAAAESFGIDFLGLPFTLVVTPDDRLLNVHIGEFNEEQADIMLATLRRFMDGELSFEEARAALAAI